MHVLRVWHNLLKRLQPFVNGKARRAKNRRTFQLETLEERTVPTIWYVAPTGVDQPGLGNDPNHPFATLQLAVNSALTGDTIEVAAGTYKYNAAYDQASANFGTTGVISVFDKQLTILGGFTTNNWTTANPTANPTIINGGGTVRGVYVVYNVNPTGLDIEGFTIENGLGGANTIRSSPDNVNGYGGGMLVDNGANPTSTVPVIVKNDTFINDTAQGVNTGSGAGGAGAGGGLAVLSGDSTSLTGITFQNDTAQGGSGPLRGGGALGGGLYVSQGAIVTGTNLTFTNDAAKGGSSTGSGVDASGQTADALGGGMAVDANSNVAFTTVNITGSSAIGGSAGTASGDLGGNGLGGGVFVANATATLAFATITNDVAQGGKAFTGNIGGGGGIGTNNANLLLNQSTVSQNTAISGNSTGGGSVGSTDGGGLSLTGYATGNSVVVNNSLITDNTAELGSSGSTANAGGGGGGLYVQAIPVTITQSTIANNHLLSGLQNGYSIVEVAGTAGAPTNLNLNYDIVSNDATALTLPLLTVQSGATIAINRTLFVIGSPAPAIVNGVNGGSPGTVDFVNGQSTDELTTTTPGFISPGSPNFNYGLLSGSPARNAAFGSTDTVDRAGNPRSGVPDLGAFQFEPASVSFLNLDNQGFKTSGTITVVIALSEPTSAAVTVNYATSDGTAKAGVDYIATSGTASIAVGATTFQFTLTVLNDGVQTGNLRVNLTLSNPTNVGLGAQSQAVATIQDVYPTDNDQFISGLYHDLLNQASTSSELSSYLTPLQGAETPLLPSVLLNFVESTGYFAQVVGNTTNGYYHRFFGENLQPGDPNVNYWADLMAGINPATGTPDGQQLTDEQVITQFVAGDQYYTGKGQSNNLTWLQNVYIDLLGRPLDSAGQAFYLPQIGAGEAGRAGVVTQILASNEYRLDLIDSYFETYLNRPTNSTDRQYWLEQFQNGETDEQVIVGIGGSLEGLLSNGGTNAKWITTLYQKLLDRQPSATELNFHLNMLENNQSYLFDNGYQLQRFYTAQSILSSKGFAVGGTFTLATDLNTLISEVYNQGLKRPAQAGELAYWSSQFIGDPNQNLDVASAILSSGEYFNDAHLYP